eukprot:COSAG03_NODE_17517_length_373_cov_1414.875912_1_plen_98_part_01
MQNSGDSDTQLIENSDTQLTNPWPGERTREESCARVLLGDPPLAARGRISGASRRQRVPPTYVCTVRQKERGGGGGGGGGAKVTARVGETGTSWGGGG